MYRRLQVGAAPPEPGPPHGGRSPEAQRNDPGGGGGPRAESERCKRTRSIAPIFARKLPAWGRA
eukprot:4543440-Pyramimonas_sp.AAC.1